MTELIDPGLPADHPRSAYLHNVLNGQCVTWFSSSLTLRELLMEVLGIIGVEFSALKFNDAGFAGNDDLIITALHGSKGSVVSVWGFEDGTTLLNNAIQWEMDRITSELSRGEYVGDAQRGVVTLIKGETSGHPFFSSPRVFDFINAAEVVPVYDVWAFKDGLAEEGNTMS